MKIIQTKGIVKDQQVKVALTEPCSNGEVDVIIIAKNELDEFEQRLTLMKEKGYDTPEKVMELIHQVKLEMLKERKIIPSEDLEIFLSAKYGQANCFVSGNRELLTAMAEFECLTPNDFIQKYLSPYSQINQ